jgi:hypothetical protein
MLTSLPVVMPVLFKKIGEKEDFQYREHYKKFNDNYEPHFSSPA